MFSLSVFSFRSTTTETKKKKERKRGVGDKHRDIGEKEERVRKQKED